jgi:hypothetical protein
MDIGKDIHLKMRNLNLNFHVKHKKKLELLVGYQLSNLGWIGAWIAATKYGMFSYPFFLFVGIVCLADILILWKEM